jgi:hypothetical protein
MPFPFGVGVGDFLAVIELARKVILALQEKRGAIASHRALLVEVRSLKTPLEITAIGLMKICDFSGRGMDINSFLRADILNGSTNLIVTGYLFLKFWRFVLSTSIHLW